MLNPRILCYKLLKEWLKLSRCVETHRVLSTLGCEEKPVRNCSMLLLHVANGGRIRLPQRLRVAVVVTHGACATAASMRVRHRPFLIVKLRRPSSERVERRTSAA